MARFTRLAWILSIESRQAFIFLVLIYNAPGGQATKLWSKLIKVSPMRGTIISQFPGNCSNSLSYCFDHSLELGFEAMANPNMVAESRFGYNNDGTMFITELGGTALRPTHSFVSTAPNAAECADKILAG